MKRLISFLLVAVLLLSLAGCSGSKIRVWDWAQSLTREDISSVEIWSMQENDYLYESVDDAQILELITLLNKLTKASFTENKRLAGITPTVGLKIQTTSESYHINYAPSPYGKYGMLEMSYQEKMWWIDDAELLAYFLAVTENVTE